MIQYLTTMAAKIYEQQNWGNKIKFIKKFVRFFQQKSCVNGSEYLKLNSYLCIAPKQ